MGIHVFVHEAMNLTLDHYVALVMVEGSLHAVHHTVRKHGPKVIRFVRVKVVHVKSDGKELLSEEHCRGIIVANDNGGPPLYLCAA